MYGGVCVLLCAEKDVLMLKQLFLCLLILILSNPVFSAGPTPELKEHRIVVLPFIAHNVSATIPNSIGDTIREKLIDLNVNAKQGARSISIINRSEMAAVLGEEKLQQTCDAFQCVSDAGQKLKADKIVMGLVYYRYGTYFIIIKAVDLGYKGDDDSAGSGASATGGRIEAASAFKVKSSSGEKLERELDKISAKISKTLYDYYSTHE